MWRSRLLLIGLCSACAAGAHGAGPVYVQSHRVLLTFTAANAAPVDEVALFLSRDGGKRWHPHPATRVGDRSLRFDVADDGWYGCYVVLKNAAGESAAAPTTGSEPHARFVVDTTPPTVQIHAVSPKEPVRPGDRVRLRLSLIDEHLGEAPVRVFYRLHEAENWCDGGPATLMDSAIEWVVPIDVRPGQFDLRLVVADRAGNRGGDVYAGLVCRETEPAAEPAPAAAGPVAVTPPPQPADPARTAAAPVTATAPKEGEVGKRAAPRERPRPAEPTLAEMSEFRRLRELAERYLSEGRYPQATAELEAALDLAPQDVGLLVDLGSALYRSERFDEADTRFAAALELAPAHIDALQGRALVAATQKRYSHARQYLERLLELTPEAGLTWLRYGDVVHRLGDQRRALTAWQKALQLGPDDERLQRKAAKRLEYFDPARRESAQ